MNQNTPYFLVDNDEIIKEISEIDAQVKEELSKPNYDNDKVVKLRFQQLLRGMYLTQSPYDMR